MLGLAIINSIKNEAPINTTKLIINASNFFMPLFNRNNKIKLSKTVMHTPIKILMFGNSK